MRLFAEFYYSPDVRRLGSDGTLHIDGRLSKENASIVAERHAKMLLDGLGVALSGFTLHRGDYYNSRIIQGYKTL